MDAEEIRKMDEASTDTSQHFVPLLWNFYAACKKEGFDEEQSFELTKTYMILILGKSPVKGTTDV